MVKTTLNLFFFLLLCSLFNTKVIFLSIILLFLAVIQSFIIASMYKIWFGMLFFFIFVSGLMVLVFYIVSMDFNSFSFEISLKKFFVFTVFFMAVLMKKNNIPNQISKNFSKFIFGYYSFLTIVSMVGLMMLVFWICTKIVFSKISSFRPLF